MCVCMHSPAVFVRSVCVYKLQLLHTIAFLFINLHAHAARGLSLHTHNTKRRPYGRTRGECNQSAQMRIALVSRWMIAHGGDGGGAMIVNTATFAGRAPVESAADCLAISLVSPLARSILESTRTHRTDYLYYLNCNVID